MLLEVTREVHTPATIHNVDIFPKSQEYITTSKSHFSSTLFLHVTEMNGLES